MNNEEFMAAYRKARGDDLTADEIRASMLRGVRAKNGAVVYDINGGRIPEDRWIEIPITPGLQMAIESGDLEAQPAGQRAAAVAQHQRRRREGVAPNPTQG